MGYKFNSQYEATCKINPEHTWKPGDEVFYDKEKKIICSIEKCYLDQGGSPIEEKKKPQFQARKRLTAEEAKGVSKALYLFALEQASESLPEINLASDLTGRVSWDRNQILDKKTDMFYKGMIRLMT